jgi:hypothetical protein
MSDELASLIQGKEKILHLLLSNLDSLRQQFVDATAKFAVNWYQATAKEYITKYPEVTLSLTKGKLAKMKTKVNTLSEKASQIVNTALSKPEVWWNQDPQLHDSFSQYEKLGNDQVGNKFPAKIDNPVRRALGELGSVLEQFGFNVTTNPAMKAAYPEFWFSYPEGEASEAQPYYPHLLVWSEDMQRIMQKYNSLFRQAIVLFNEIQKLKDEIKRQQASNLWDTT